MLLQTLSHLNLSFSRVNCDHTYTAKFVIIWEKILAYVKKYQIELENILTHDAFGKFPIINV